MYAFKLKAAAAAILIASTLGLGAWAAGAGEDPGKKDSSGKASTALPPAKVQDFDLTKIRLELKAIEQELIDLLIESKSAGDKQPESVKRRIHLAEEKLTELRRLMAQAREHQNPSSTEVSSKLDAGLKDLQGKWKIESIKYGKTVEQLDPKVELVIEIVGDSLFMPYREIDGTVKRNECKIVVDATKNPKTIDSIQPRKPVGKGAYEFKPAGKGIYEFTASVTTCTTCHKALFDSKEEAKDLLDLCTPGIKLATGLRLAIAMNAPQPTKFGGSEGVLEFQLTRVESEQLHNFRKEIDKVKGRLLEETLRFQEAKAVEEEARAQLARAQAQVAQAKAEVEVAVKQLEEARARIAAFEKLTTPTKPLPLGVGKEEASFTVHIRTQFAPEKVIRVKTTGSQTVLEGLAYAAEDMAIKPDAISVWVVREKGLLPVDLAAITQKADPKTNYQLKPGDQLFVQVKVGK